MQMDKPISWHVLGASVTGSSHLQTGHGCDDACAYRILDDMLYLAIADGAGTAIHSAIGATTAVQTALDTAALLLQGQIEPSQPDQWKSALSLILQAAHQAIVQQIPNDPLPTSPSPTRQLNAFATTLLFVSVTKHWIAVAQIGDGAVVIQQKDGTIKSLTHPYQDEYINETNFLTDANYLSQVDYSVLARNDIQSIAMLTDGLQLLAMNYPENTPHQPFFTRTFSFANRPDATEAELRAFLASDRVCERTDDDKTLLLAVYQ
jgi:Protein phosphatase 2C